MEQRRRIGAYGLCRNGDQVLLVRAASTTPFPGVWQLPGGGVRHAEHPADAVVREFAEETGLTVRVTGLRAVVADVFRYADADADTDADTDADADTDTDTDTDTGAAGADAGTGGGGVAVHVDRIVYDVTPVSGELRTEPAGSTDRLDWVAAAAPDLPLMPFTAELLGLPVTPLPAPLPRRRSPHRVPEVDRRQRFGAYALATDPADRVLLAMIADGYPGAGRWHLPGGGTDHGEQPVTALLRELVEETGQLGRVTGLLGVDSLHNPAAQGPEERPLDWHGVRAVYRVRVEEPTEPRVTEAAGGSTARAAWFPTTELRTLPLTEIAARFVGHISM
ncbi:NUDIX hydrolase [Micromonospora echinofusca]|uniref:NUDIX domain-containing protein n=1 Tax=Micromonospora echinofusca TaxID=47858 RepID=A0ABS3VX82_MICEH|nr:NUDIX domain-containing protein [Micromonospora echinofusca]MBO4209081.1 NUDIX domain-containing protein [Micromonospora echinofusca]